MTDRSKNSGSLKVDIRSSQMDTSSIPKQIQVLGADLSLKETAWVNNNEWQHDLPAGMYVVRLNFSSGTQMEQVVELGEERTTNTVFDIDELGTNQAVDWRYLVKSNAVSDIQSSEFRNDQKPVFLQNISGRRWQWNGSGWQALDIDTMQDQLISAEGTHYQLFTSEMLEMLELRGPDRDSIFICLPPGHTLDILITAGEGPFSTVTDLDVCITTTNYKAQSLLSLISAGDINKARTLITVKEAEQLLFEKMADPASAAIGGYFLLKTGELERMHDWAKNLANRFEWFPDGLVLYAWQLIQDKNQAEGVSNNAIKQLLLEAVRRGVPVYTEGLRLLYEGINMMAYEEGHSDQEVSAACTLVRKYVDAADMGKDTTTFTGSAPDKPGFSRVKSR